MAPIDTSHFSDRARKDLLQLLESVPGKKNLVLHKSLVGPIELLVKFSTLQENGVHRIFFLENDNVDSSQRNVVFVAWGEKAKQSSAIASQVKRLQRTGQIDHDYTIFWVPRRTLVCERILEDEGVLGEVTSLEWPLYFQTLETDVLSMELENSFGEMYLRKDPTSIYLAAKALMLLQKQHGLFPRIQGKGDQAKRLADLLIRMRSETSAGQDGVSKVLMPSTTIENLIIVDRDVDFGTALLTQLTYEGLIDEMFGIRQNQAEVSSSIVGVAPQQSSQAAPSTQPVASLKRKIKLDSSDKLYGELRDANFAIVGSLLNKVARRLQQDYEGRHGQKTIGELRDFVNKLPGFQTEQQSLKIHTSLAEEVMKQTRSETFSRVLEIQQNFIAGTDATSFHDTIEDLIARDCPLPTILRLLCLESVVAGGLRARDYDNFRRQVVQAFGYQHMVTLDALEKMQLLVQSRGGTSAFYIPGAGGSATTSTTTNYSSVRRPLHLILDEVSEQDPSDIAYVYSGYAPLSVRLVQCILQKPYLQSLSSSKPAAAATVSASTGDPSQGWRGFEDVLRSVKGATFDETQGVVDGAAAARQVLAGHGSGEKTTVVFFLGGITFAEIAALRFMAGQEAKKRRILVCTTAVISGDKMMQVAIDASRPKKA